MPFDKLNRPLLPDAYFNFDTQSAPVVPPGPGSTVAIPIVHDWGPFEVATLCTSFADFQAKFGSSDDTDGYRAVRQAFIGEGLPGRGGAGAVLVYRFGGSAAKAANHILKNTVGSPENAITITAKYKGSRGDDFRLTTRDHAADASKNELLLLDGTSVLETYVYADANITELGAQINAKSNWVVATVTKTAVALATVTSVALTEGNDGASLTAENWTEMLDQIALERFGVFAPYKLTDEGIIASINAWVIDQNDNKQKRFMAVVGGEKSETMEEANERSESLANPEVLNLGAGLYEDSTLGPNGTPFQVGPAELAPRIAGILAQKGEYAAITYARLAGLSILTGPTDAEIAAAYDGGTVALARDDDDEAPTHLKVGHSTWTEADANGELNDQGDPVRPYIVYREPKYVRTMHGIQTDLGKYFRSEILGSRPVNDASRDAVVGEAKNVLAERQVLNVIQSGWAVGIDQEPPPSDDDEFVALVMELKFGRTLKQVYVTLKVG